MQFVVAGLFLVLIVALGFAFLVILQLVSQAGRILLRLEAIEAHLSGSPGSDDSVEDYVASLQRGVSAPPIELPDLSGVPRRLSEWRGSRVLLVFFDPECTFSKALLPSLVALTADVVPGRPVPVIVTTGTREANLALFDSVGFSKQVLLQAGTEVAAAYRVDGTPMSYLLDSDGTIVNDVAVGVQSTLILAGDIGAVADATENPPAEDLASPVAQRDGLAVGSTAPLFRLPRVGGGELSLLEFRGSDVVLIFFDPDCEPCDELAPRLEAMRGDHPALNVLIISRGDVAANEAKVAQLGLTLPVGLQRHWELSREYGIFATPVAYHIDEWGLIGADVAVGNDRIIELLEATRAAQWAG